MESKPKLYLPKTCDRKAWKEVDNELSEALESLPFYKDPTVELERREIFICNFLKEKYGIKQPPKPKDEKKIHKSRQQKRLRKMKQDLKKSLKKAMKDNKTDQEIRKMTEEFLKAMRLHDKIRKMELKQKEKMSQLPWLHTQEAFNKNLHQYAKTLLDPKAAQGKPGFSREVAINEYFQTRYEDKKRDYQYNPLKGIPNIPKPAAPRKQLSKNPPSLAELY